MAAKPTPTAHARYHYPREFEKALAFALQHTLQHQGVGGLLVVEIENLSMIINAHGHISSEEVMENLASAIGHLVDAEGGSIHRIQRDQFALVLPHSGSDVVSVLGNKINHLVQNFGATSPLAVHVVSNIGSVLFPGSANTLTDVIDKALIALNNRNSLNYAAYETGLAMQRESVQHMELAKYLSTAIQGGRLKLAFQPVIAAKNGQVDHYECLLRMVGDEGKISSAGMLIPVAERMGLISIVDLLVLEMVTEELLRSPNVQLAFNISNITTGNNDWLNEMKRVLKRHPEIASRMIVEITETAAHRDIRETAYFIASLQEHGCQVSLDDFGSGYTSLRQLKSLSVDSVKIDGSFVKDLVDNADNRFFVKTLLDFTTGMGMHSVAEYVETGEVAKLLMDLGIDFMQGYYFGKPEVHRPWLDDGEYHVL